MRKKILAAILAATMVASLTACGSGATTTEAPVATEAAEEGAETPAEEATEAEAPAEEEEAITATITVWSPQEDQSADAGNWLPTMCEQFAALHPNWTLTFEYGVCPEGDAKTTVSQDVEAAADVYFLANDNIPDLVGAEALAELGGKYLEEVTSTNSDSIVASVSFNDGVWAFPFTSNTWFMYYDKSVFSEDDVKSFDTMLEKGKVSFPLSNSWYIAAFYAANGGSLFGDGTNAEAGIDFGGDKGVAVTNYLVDLAANANFVNDADGAGLAGLRDGSINAIFSGTWDAEAVKEALGDNMGVAALPTVTIDGKEGQLKSFMGSKAIGVNPNAENMEVAISLAAYLAGEEAQTAHYNTRNILPTNTNVALAEDPIATAVSGVMAGSSMMQPVITPMSNYWGPAENMGKAIVAGEITHDNAAEKTEEMNTAMNTDFAQ